MNYTLRKNMAYGLFFGLMSTVSVGANTPTPTPTPTVTPTPTATPTPIVTPTPTPTPNPNGLTDKQLHAVMGIITNFILSESSSLIPNKRELAIEKISKYADSLSEVPTVQDYINAGVIGVTFANLNDINQAVKATTSSNVNTTAEIQVLVNSIINQPSSKLKLLSPTLSSSIKYTYVTLEVDDSVNDVKAKVNGREYIGVKNSSSFFIYNVALIKGKNTIELIGDNGIEKRTIEINSESKGFAPLVLELDKTEGYDSLEINAEVKNNGITITSYLIDKDGDKITETKSSSAVFKLSYSKSGNFSPKVIVRTSDNVLYAVSASDSVNIIENPLSNTQTITGASGVQDLEEYGAYIYALTGSSLIKISENNSSDTSTINLSGLSGAKGFTFDSDGNIFVADTGNNRVVKYLASNNYQLDSSFSVNINGSKKGEVSSPTDVTVSSVGTSIRVFVLDTGNNRIQVFNHVGAYLADIDGSSTAEGKLSSPLNMIGSSSMIISDAGNSMIRELNYNEITKGESGKKLLTGTFGKVTYSSDGLLVSDNGNKQFTFFNITGDIQKQLPTTSTNLIALSYENNHQLLQVKNGGSVEHIYIPKTVPSASPKALAEKFVKAYLDGDDATMLLLTSKSNIDRLKKIDTKVKEAFNGMSLYNERIYMNGLRAVVNGETIVPIGKISIKFYFNWTTNKWSLIEVI